MRTDELDYPLPKELIAHRPVEPRDASRLLVLERDTGRCSHHLFRDLPELLRPGDCLVLNETRVMPYRLVGTKTEGGARIEVLLLEPGEEENIWRAMAYRARRLRPGVHIRFGEDFQCEVREDLGGGRFVLQFENRGDFAELLEKYGEVPLPPYVERPTGIEPEDRQRYQTVFARWPGSSAAPTAGLHFTPELIARLESRGVRFAQITLHIGQDTFQPIQTPTLEAHPIHSERYEISPEAARIINANRQAGGRTIAVGSTSVRTLESAAGEGSTVTPGSGTTRLYIRPGYSFRMVQALITNFHLPRTTLLALVAAFAGSDQWRAAYEEAIRDRYRFYSFGDAMLIE